MQDDYVINMESSNPQNPDVIPPSLPQNYLPPTEAPYGQPIQEPPSTNLMFVKQAFRYLLIYVGLTFLGFLMLALPVAGLLLILDKIFPLGHYISIKGWILGFSGIGAQLLPLYVFWKKKWCDFSWIRTPRLGKILLWIVVAWLGFMCIDLFIVEVYTHLSIDVNSQESVSESGAIPLALIAGCILAPLAEEAFFRGTFERILLKTNWNPWYAIMASALVFALFHVDLYVSTMTFIAGLLMGWIYYRTRNIWLTVFLHALNNTLSSMVDFVDDFFEGTALDADMPFYIYVLSSVAGIILIGVSIRAIGKIVARNEEMMAMNQGTDHADNSIF